MNTLGKVVKVAQKFHELRITESEISFCLYIFLIKEAKRLHPNPKQFDYLFNDLFRDLKTYYDRSYSDTAICFGNLMIAIDLINVSFDVAHSHSISFCLGTKDRRK